MFDFMSYTFFGHSATDHFGHVVVLQFPPVWASASARLPCLGGSSESCWGQISESTNFYSNGSPVATIKYFTLILVQDNARYQGSSLTLSNMS